MSNEIQSRDLPGKDIQDRVSRLSPSQREMLQRRLRGEAPQSQASSTIQRRRGTDYPVTAEQEHLWLLHQVDADVYYFNHTHAYLLRGDLKVSALERALNEVLRRHENFRTSFPEVGGKPRAKVAPELKMKLEVINVPEFPVEDRRDRLQRLITASICHPFDILNGPLIRASLYRAAENEHAIVVTMHHILTDFVSYALFDRELFTVYEAFSRGLPSPLPELTIQYGDFASWLDDWMKSEEATKQAEYWIKKLADMPRLDLPTDMPRPRFRTFRGERVRWDLPPDIWEGFKRLSLAENVTRFTTFLVLYAMLMRAYSGKDDVAIATPVSIRKHRDTQPLIGYFLNTIVFRVDLSGDPTFHELLQRTRTLNLEALANSDLPFEALLNKLRVDRDPGRPPLVDSSYAFANDSTGPAPIKGGMAIEAFDPFYRSAWLDINLGVNDNGDHAVIVLDYVVDLFRNETVQRMMVHFQRLCAQAIATPERTITSFTLLDEIERQQVLVEWNNKIAPYLSDATVHGCFAGQAARTGNEIAIRSAEESITYGDLNVRANQLAHRLIRMGVGPETRVGILMERSPNVVIASMAVLKAGGSYLPLHSGYPADRLAMILEEAEAPVLLLDRSMDNRGFKHSESIVVDDDPFLAAEDETDPGVVVHPEQLAYVIYTSGSTGKPKGVAITHRSVLSLAFDRGWLEGSLERVLLHSSHAFDASTFEMWTPLLRGKQVVMAPSGELDISTFERVIAEGKITYVFMTCGLFHALAQESPGCFSGLREVWTGGDVVSAAAVQRVRDHCPNTVVSNVYGPTETTTFITHYAVCGLDKVEGNLPIGRAMDNHQTYIVDAQLQPVPAGVPGELCLAGPGVARGYLKNPDLTAERFVPDPFGAPGTRMYRTGDLARWRSDGQLEFLGRRDQQIKLRGFRVELGELESALVRCAGVGQAAALVREDRPGEKRLVAYVVAAPGRSVQPEELRLSLANMLPDYMVPAVITVIDSLPLTSNGKLDRKALPAPEMVSSGAGSAPRTQAEKALCSLLGDLLGNPRVSLEDNFFSLGGDSILAIQLISRARQAGLVVTLRDVFEQQSIEALASVAHPVLDDVAEAPDRGVGLMQPLPIMHWYLEHVGSAHRFSQSTLLQVPAELTEDGLKKALQAVLDHHDALRLRFTGSSASREKWVLEVRPPGAVDAGTCLRTMTVAALDASSMQDVIAKEADAASARLSPEAGVMLQAVWFDAGRSKPGRLLLAIHHFVVDGVSWRILVPDLAAAWTAIAAGGSPALAPTGTSFRGWAERLNTEALNPARVKELPLWTNMLNEPSVMVPGRRLDPAIDTSGTARQLMLTLPSSITAPLLNKVAAAFHTQINDILLTGLVLSVLRWRHLHNHGNSSAVLIDLEAHGREGIFDGADLSRTVGFFTAMYPVRLDAGTRDLEQAWAGGAALGRILKSIKEQLNAIPDHGIGYGLLRYLNPETAPAFTDAAVPEIDFNYLGRFPSLDATDWVAAEALTGGIDPDAPFHHPLEVDGLVLERPSGPEFIATWTWMPRILGDQDIKEMADGWFHVLQALVHHATQPDAGGLTPSDVPLVTVSQPEIDRLEHEHGMLEDILPLAPVQEGLLYHAAYDTQGPDVYNVQMVLTLEGPLDEEALQASVKALLRRHANLRSGFRHEGLNRPVQVVPRDISLQWSRLDLSSLSDSEREQRVTQIVFEDRRQRFNPGKPPLFRFVMLRYSQEKHRLVICTHHILLDGWSVPLLLHELMALYANKGNMASLPRVTPFRNYLKWLASRDRSAAETAWLEALAGFGESTCLSSAGQPVEAKIPERVDMNIDSELSRKLTDLARSRSLTLNTVVQVAWAILLARLTGRNDVAFGTTVSGRPPEISGIEAMIGLFINTLPVRVQVRSGDSFAQLLTRVQTQQAQLLAHQHLGLVDIQRLTGLHELFDTLVVFENFPEDLSAIQQSFGGVRLTHVEGSDATHYPLTLAVLPEQRLHIHFDYHADCFSRDAIEVITQRMLRVLRALAANPDQLIGSVDVLADQERQRMLVAWNQTATEYPREQSIVELFDEQAARRGDEVAVVFGNDKISYRELDKRSNQVGHYLRTLGVGPESPVGICMERGIELVVATLGILKAGGAYVPLDPAYPQERLRFMLEDTALSVVVTQERQLQQLPDTDARPVCLDRDWKEIARQSDKKVAGGPRAEHLAYVIYTSGSTGRPKGVEVTQRNVVRLARGSDYVRFKGDEIVAQVSNASFDAATFEIWGALLNGSRLVIIANEVLLDAGKLTTEIQRQGVDVMFLTTGLFNELARQNPGTIASVKQLLFGGDTADLSAVTTLLQHGGVVRLVNMYGPTEGTTFATWYLTNELANEAKNVPIGRPVANTQVYVLDHEMNVAPEGVAGELYIGGEGVGRGYWRRPELTAEKFVPNPFSAEPGTRLYRSGDRVRWAASGQLEFLGRVDNQIKIRGFRVELGEIEAALRQQTGVRDCAVVLKQGAEGKRLVAYVVGEIGGEELRKYLKGRLPEYMVPSVYVRLEQLPLNANGKVDRKALPDVEGERLDTAGQYQAPRTAVEELLADIWAEVLGIERVGMQNNFFELGGHSLLALRVISRMNDHFQIELSVRVLLEFPALKDFTQVLLTTTPRSAQELEKMASIGLMVRKMTPEQRRAALQAL